MVDSAPHKLERNIIRSTSESSKTDVCTIQKEQCLLMKYLPRSFSGALLSASGSEIYFKQLFFFIIP